jgi:general secretion pathway protein G
MKIIKKVRSAFTLIELLVVIAIIGMLAALFLPNFMAARERARDTIRKSDLRQIQKAFELYKQDQTNSSFPAALPAPGAVFSNGAGTIYMSKFPGDPNRVGGNYYYSRGGDLISYKLCACLENKADPDGTSADCNNVNYLCSSSGKSYVVNQP